MSHEPLYDIKSFRNPRDKRLAREHMQLHELCERAERISYQIVGDKRLPPESYEITYQLKSIVGIQQDSQPIYGDKHILEISLPAGYPAKDVAKCYMKSPIWHPNVKWEGRFKGRVCVNAKEFGNLYFIDDLVLRVGMILQYQNYHAKNEQPYPEDEKVAQWVREFAEPQGIVNKDRKIFVDSTSLLSALPESNPQDSEEEAPEGKKKLLKIKSRKASPPPSKDGKINISFRDKDK